MSNTSAATAERDAIFACRLGSSKNPEAAKLKEYAAFDVLRFLLAFAVLLNHAGILTWIQSGNLAVQVFFALSGWLIGSILCKTTPVGLSRFYFNRATRIWIPYFVCVAALYFVSRIHDHVFSNRWREFLIYDVTFTHNWFSLLPNAKLALTEMPLQGTGNHLWSIAVEEQFYLAAPLILTLLPFGRRILTWVIVATVAILTKSWYASVSLGVLCAVIAQTYPGWQVKRPARLGLLCAMGASSVLISMSAPSYFYVAPFFSTAVVLLCAVPLKRTTVSEWLGGVSFPLYLNAWIGVFAFHWFAKRHDLLLQWYFEPIAAMCAVLGAAVSYHLIDRIVMINRNKYYAIPLGWALAGTAYGLVAIGFLYGYLRSGGRMGWP